MQGRRGGAGREPAGERPPSPTATQNQRTDSAPGAACSPHARQGARGRRRGRGPVGRRGGDQQVAAVAPRRRRAAPPGAAARRAGRGAAGPTRRPDWSAYSRATSAAEAPDGTTQVEDADRPVDAEGEAVTRPRDTGHVDSPVGPRAPAAREVQGSPFPRRRLRAGSAHERRPGEHLSSTHLATTAEHVGTTSRDRPRTGAATPDHHGPAALALTLAARRWPPAGTAPTAPRPTRRPRPAPPPAPARPRAPPRAPATGKAVETSWFRARAPAGLAGRGDGAGLRDLRPHDPGATASSPSGPSRPTATPSPWPSSRTTRCAATPGRSARRSSRRRRWPGSRRTTCAARWAAGCFADVYGRCTRAAGRARHRDRGLGGGSTRRSWTPCSRAGSGSSTGAHRRRAYHRATQGRQGDFLSTTLRGARLDEPEMPTGQIVLQPPPQIEPERGRQRRPDERDPDARQPRLDRAGRDHGRRRPAAAATSRPACSCSRPSASSSSSSTGSGSSAPSR